MKNSVSASNPARSNRKIFVLAAVCFSIIVAVSAYRIAVAVRVSAEKQQNSIIASASGNADGIAPETMGSKVMNALEQAQLEAQATTTYNPFAPSKDDTLTDRLSKNFFAAYAQNQLASNVNPDMQTTDIDAETIANNAIASVDTSTMPKSKYSLSALAVISGGNTAELHAYGNAVASIQAEEFKKISDNPNAYKNDLRALAPVYRAIGERLIRVQVPVALSIQHLEIVNDFILSADTFPLIQDQTKDPLKALIAMREYKDAVGRQGEMYTEIADYFHSNAILFDKTEPGTFWTAVTERSTSPTADVSRQSQ